METVAYTTPNNIFTKLNKLNDKILTVYVPVGPYSEKYFPDEFSGGEAENLYISYCAQMEQLQEDPQKGYLISSTQMPVRFEMFPVVSISNKRIWLNLFLELVKKHFQGKKPNIGVSSIPRKIFIPSGAFGGFTNLEVLEFEIELLSREFTEIEIYFGFKVQDEQDKTLSSV